MKADDSLGRVRRLKYWIAALTLIPGTVLLFAGSIRTAAGFTTGGLVVFLNLVGTERAVLAFVRGTGVGRFMIILLYSLKLALIAALLAVALLVARVSSTALLLGVTTFLIALVFDFLTFPRNIGESEEL